MQPRHPDARQDRIVRLFFYKKNIVFVFCVFFQKWWDGGLKMFAAVRKERNTDPIIALSRWGSVLPSMYAKERYCHDVIEFFRYVPADLLVMAGPSVSCR